MENNKSKITRTVLLIVGTICVALGSIGIIIPVLPTTPFLLLAAGCYVKASQRCYNWLMNHKLFGAFIKGYIEGSGVPVKSKLIAIAYLWIGISISIIMLKTLWVQILLICIATAVTIHIALIKPKQKATRTIDE